MSNEHPDLPILHSSNRRRFGVRGASRRPPGRKGPAASSLDYDAAFERVLPRVRTLDRILGRERREAPALLAALEPHPQPRRLLRRSGHRRPNRSRSVDTIDDSRARARPRR